MFSYFSLVSTNSIVIAVNAYRVQRLKKYTQKYLVQTKKTSVLQILQVGVVPGLFNPEKKNISRDISYKSKNSSKRDRLRYVSTLILTLNIFQTQNNSTTNLYT